MGKITKKSLFLSITILLAVHFLYYPKWQKGGTEATISWDVSGYYFYLPSIFIYKDLKKNAFAPDILEKYHPTPDLQQVFLHPASGNYVMKYSAGQALSYLPGFAVGHLWASISNQYPADGFSFPYQFCISMGSLIWAILGLILLSLILSHYFPDNISAITIVSLFIGSNYLNYTAIDGAMTHNTLFTIYTFLIYLSIKFHKKPSITKALGIGALVGLAGLTRPTELLSCLIPILWGLDIFNKEAIYTRLKFFKENFLLLSTAVVICVAIGSIQLIYWKYVANEWTVYSYEDQGFSWLRPHIFDGLFSYKSGWLMYSPFMVFSLLGFLLLFFKKRYLFYVSLIFSCLFIYIAFAWDIWWYGGSLGQRTMVQCYPILAFPLAAFFQGVHKTNLLVKTVIGIIMAILISISLWFTYQAHTGGIFYTAQMTKAYYWNTLLTFKKKSENLKLLDEVDELYKGTRQQLQLVNYDSSYVARLDKDTKFSPEFITPNSTLPQTYDWLRVSATCSIGPKEWNTWKMTQFIVEFKNADKLVHHQTFRIQRHLSDNETKRIGIDIRRPKETFTDIIVRFYNVNSDKAITINEVKLEAFKAD